MAEDEEAQEETVLDHAMLFDIPTDAYGATVLALVKVQCPLPGEDIRLNRVSCVFILCANFLNLVLQFSLVYFISTQVVAAKVYDVQRNYEAFHARMFTTEGKMKLDRWSSYPYKDDLCEIAMSSHAFYYSILLLWVLAMLRELRVSLELLAQINSVPSARRGEDMLSTKISPGKTLIVKLTFRAKLLMNVLVCLPKIAICLSLLWLGCEWLSATQHFEELVINAVAMKFVTEIDELLFDVLIPNEYQQDVEDVDFLLPSEKVRLGSRVNSLHNHEDRELALGYASSAVFLVLSCVFVWVYAHVIQNVLPSNIDDLTMLCGMYVRNITTPICQRPFWDLWANPTMVITGCYPYGQSAPLADLDLIDSD